MNLVVDASALFEVLLWTPTGQSVARRLTAEEVLAPDIIDAEVASAVRRHLQAGRISESLATRALDVLLDWPGQRVGTRLLVRGSRAYWPAVTAYDSLYVMLAATSAGTLLTCDGRLARATGLDVPVEDVRVT